MKHPTKTISIRAFYSVIRNGERGYVPVTDLTREEVNRVAVKMGPERRSALLSHWAQAQYREGKPDR